MYITFILNRIKVDILKNEVETLKSLMLSYSAIYVGKPKDYDWQEISNFT